MLHDAYLSLPATIQNIALSAYGARIYRQRFGKKVEAPYNNNQKLFQRPTNIEIDAQTLRLRELLQHCKDYVPYYMPYLSNVNVATITAENLSQHLPKLNKKQLLDNPKQFLSLHPNYKKNLIKLNTSGSSGTPLTIYSSAEARRINYHFFDLALQAFECHYRSKKTILAGRILYKNVTSSPARYDYFNHTQYLSSYFISETTIHKYIDALNQWRPEFIDSYPSALFQIQALARAQNLKPLFQPKFILTSSENLTSETKNAIETFFNAPIIDNYGCTEMSICAFSKDSQYFVPPLYSVVELEHAFDDFYSVIATGLLNFSMPLLRYEIGDLVESKSQGTNYIFDKIEGRIDDVVITPEGRKIGRMDPAFKGVEGVEQSQIIQTAIDKLLVLIKMSTNTTSFNEDLLIANIKMRTSQKMQIDIKYVEDIEKTKNGKFKSVVSQINNN